jgi:MFS family permease
MLQSQAPFHALPSLLRWRIDREIAEVGFFQLCSILGRDLVGLSIIFFMLNTLGYAVWQVFFFFSLRSLPFLLSHPFIIPVIKKLGIKQAISMRAVVNILFYLSLPILMTGDFWMSMLLMSPLMILRGFFQNVNNVSYDVFLAYHMNRKNKGSVLSWMQITIILGALIAPILGAFITESFGFQYVTYFGIAIMLIGMVVLYTTPDEKFDLPYTGKKMINDTIYNTPKRLFAAETGRVFFDTALVLVWPVFLFLVIKDFMALGTLIAVSSTVSMVIAFFVGKRIDQSKKRPKEILRWGVYRSTVLNFLRAVWFEPVILGVIDALSRINDQTIKVPYDVEFYKWLNTGNIIEKAHIRRFISEGLYVFFYFIITGLFFVFETAPVWLFVIVFGVAAFSLSLTQQVTKLRLTVDHE